jgi:hypothetical protein
MADFVEYPQDDFSPEYGGIRWKFRFNNMLEQAGVGITPVGYSEGAEPMQVTQENTILYINQVADEMDCVAVKYDLDPQDIWTWYFREKFTDDETFARVVQAVGPWAMQIITLYPMEHVVNQYEAFNSTDLGELDHIPDDWA